MRFLFVRLLPLKNNWLNFVQSILLVHNNILFMVRVEHVHDLVCEICRIFVESSEDEEDKESENDDEATEETEGGSVVYASYTERLYWL